MNVPALMRKELNVDEKRTYLLGHSMGGAGTLYQGWDAGYLQILQGTSQIVYEIDSLILSEMISLPNS
jgi:hypothetical protein